MRDTSFGIVGFAVAIAFFAATIFGVLWAWQHFKVFQAEYSGKAVLAEAEFSRQVAVKEAQARKDSAALLAEAEVLRAEGVAKANAIVADGLGGAEGYLRYLYIQMLDGNPEKQVIYIPTEAGLPVLEAGKR